MAHHAELDPSLLKFETFRAAGPGGQNVNRVATAVRLRYDLRRAPLPEDVKARAARLAGDRLTGEGEILIEARRYRTQERNRQDALERLRDLLARARQRPRPRRATRPTRASVERRLAKKKRRGEIKRARRRLRPGEEDG